MSGWIFWTIKFHDLKKFTLYLSNEGTNFMLSALEVGQ